MNVYLNVLKLDITKKENYEIQDIKRAFKKQAMKWHPDRNAHQIEKATKKMQEINEAKIYLTKIFEIVKKSVNVNPIPPPSKPNIRKQKQPIATKQPVNNKKQDQIKKQNEIKKQDEIKKQNEKDESLETECLFWKKKMGNRQPPEMDFLITAKIIYIDLFRGEMEPFNGSNYIDSNIKEQIAQIWFQCPTSKGICKYAHLFVGENYIIQNIHSSADHAFYSREKIKHYLHQRANWLAANTSPITNLNKKEITIILSLLQNNIV